MGMDMEIWEWVWVWAWVDMEDMEDNIINSHPNMEETLMATKTTEEVSSNQVVSIINLLLMDRIMTK